MRSFPMTKIRLGLPISILGFAVLSLLTTAGIFAYLLLGARTVRVDADRVTVAGPLYSTSVPRAEIDPAGVRVVDLDQAPELALSRKDNGLGLPGLKEGWFSLANGQKAFALLTDTARVVVVPTRTGSWLLLSAADADKLVAQLAPSASP